MITYKIALLDTKVIDDFSNYINQLKEFGFDVHILKVTNKYPEDLDRVTDYCIKNNITHVLASSMDEIDYQVALNKELNGKSAPDIRALSKLKNKYCQRMLDKNAQIWFNPVYLEDSNEELLGKVVDYPCMLKATTAYLGRYIYRIFNESQLLKVVNDLRNDLDFLQAVSNQYNDQPPLIVETCLDLSRVRQFSIDCYTSDKSCFIYSLREEIYLLDQTKIGYMFPPSITKEEGNRIEAYLHELGEKIVNEGLINHFFNVEIFLTEDDHLILTEINVLWNINYIHTMDLLNQGNMLEVIFRHMREGAESIVSTPFKRFMEGEVPETVCLQSLIQITAPGNVGDFIDFDEIESLKANPKYRITKFLEPNYVVTENRIPISGLDCVNIWHYSTNKMKALKKDESLRISVLKNVPSN